MEHENNRFVFTQIAKELGYPEDTPWPDDQCMKLLEYFDTCAASGQPVVFEKHCVGWAMLAILQKLRKNEVSLYIPPLGRSLELAPMKRVAEPGENPMMRFDITDRGEDVHIVVTLLNDGNPNPFQVPFRDIEIREIGTGKNIWLEFAEGKGHYLFVFDMPKTFGDDCRTMYYKEEGTTWYCVASNDPAVKVGDKPAKSPFE